MTSTSSLDQSLTMQPVTPMTSQKPTGSNTMYTMYEALARDRMREARAEAHQRRAVQVLSAQKRWRRLERRATAAQLRARQAQRRNALHMV